MAIRPIIRLGHPVLRTPAAPLDPGSLASPEIQTLVDDMYETMQDAGGVGLAATQLGLGVQLFVYAVVDPDAVDSKELEPEEPELEVLINPAIEPVSGELVYDWEGCLSIPDLRGLVPRHPAVRVRALDRDGQRVDFRAEGYEARIIQHEFDHLNGVVFLDRMRDLQSLAYAAEWEEFMTTEDDEGLPVG